MSICYWVRGARLGALAAELLEVLRWIPPRLSFRRLANRFLVSSGVAPGCATSSWLSHSPCTWSWAPQRSPPLKRPPSRQFRVTCCSCGKSFSDDIRISRVSVIELLWEWEGGGWWCYSIIIIIISVIIEADSIILFVWMQKRLVSFLEINFARTMFPISTPHFGAGFSFFFFLSQVVELFSFCALLRRRFVGFHCFTSLVVCVVLSLKESRRGTSGHNECFTRLLWPFVVTRKKFGETIVEMEGEERNPCFSFNWVWGVFQEVI